MTINKNIENNKANLSLEGRLDTTTAPILEEELKLFDASIDTVTLNFEKLDYMSSAGLRVLLMFAKRYKDNFNIVKVNEDILEVLEMTGFSDIIAIN